MTKTERARDRDVARVWFRTHCPPGTTVFTVLDHVSRSGMRRRIRVLVPRTGDTRSVDFFHPNAAASVLTGFPQAAADAGQGAGLQVGGCGMDMGFHLVYTLSHETYPEGFGCIGAHCPSNDHGNGDRDDTPHHGPARAGHWHLDGGYALVQRWL